MNEVVVDIKNVKKSFRTKKAVNDLSLSVSRGKITGILGPNGAGKSTMIRMLMGIMIPDSGEVIYHLDSHEKIPRSRIGFLPEERGLYKNEKVMDVILYLADLKDYDKEKAKQRALDLLVRFGLEGHEKSKIEELSKGMAQKVQFIGAIIHEPEFLILDEPFSGLDPVSQDVFKEEIQALADNGTAILLSAHQMNIVERLCDEIFLIHKGEKVVYDTVNHIKEQFSNYKCVLVNTDTTYPFNEDERVERVEIEGNQTTIHFHQDVHPLSYIRSFPDDLHWDELHIDRKSLHDIFVSIAKGEDS